MELDIEVIFGRSGYGHIQGLTLPFDGKGRVRISGDTVTFSAPSDRALSSTQYEALTFALAQFANVGINGKQVLFSIYPPGDDREGTPQFIGTVHTKRREDAQRFFEALPRKLSADMKKMAAERNAFAASVFAVTPKAFFTPLILTANVAVFVAMVVNGVGIFQPAIDDLIRWGADFGPLTFTGEWWRIVTNTFLHIGLIHLALNMWVLNNIGRVVERMYGNALFILIYLAAGITGSLASLWMNPETVSAGASGAIFGLYGALLGFSLRQKHAIPKSILKELQSSSIGFVAYNVIYGFSIAGIDNAAHLGGLFGGTVLGYVAAMPLEVNVRKAALPQRLLQTCAVFAVLAASLYALTPRAVYVEYFRYVDYFATKEEEAVTAQNDISDRVHADQLTAEAAAEQLETEALARWEEVRAKGQAVRLPKKSVYHRTRDGLVEYARLMTESLRKVIAGIRADNEELVEEGLRLRQKAEALAERMAGE